MKKTKESRGRAGWFGLVVVLVTCAFSHFALAQEGEGLRAIAEKNFGGKEGAFVFIDGASGKKTVFNEGVAAEKLPPCSSFKIWNSLFGLEEGVLKSPDAPFYVWDGVKRGLDDWNRDLTLKQAFQVSCVPAYQGLAREIGEEKMRAWVKKIGYGDGDTAAGIDVFWLPAEGRKTILISAEEQAELLRRLVSGEMPFSEKTVQELREIMRVKTTDKGELFGKTGSGAGADGTYRLGWFVGFVQSGGSVHPFACVVRGEGLMGKDARAIVESIFADNGQDV